MSARPVPWQDLEYFLAVARTGTLAAAASRLGVSSATVHRRIGALEKSLSTRLFTRSPRGYTLMPAGSELLEHVHAIDHEVLAAERRVGGRDQQLSGIVRVATVDDLAYMVLGDIVHAFALRHERVCVETIVDSDRSDLARRQADVAIRLGSQPPDGDVIARRVCGIDIALYASQAYLDRSEPIDSLESLARHRLVRGEEQRADLPMERFIDRHGRTGTAVFRSNSMLARLAAIRSGLGIGLLPCFAADFEGSLVRLGEVRPEVTASLWILVHADLRRNARVRTFVEFAHAQLTERRHRFECGIGTSPPAA
jgi:DNA-binding transcriptional LysR family regulator